MYKGKGRYAGLVVCSAVAVVVMVSIPMLWELGVELGVAVLIAFLVVGYLYASYLIGIMRIPFEAYVVKYVLLAAYSLVPYLLVLELCGVITDVGINDLNALHTGISIIASLIGVGTWKLIIWYVDEA